MSVFPGDAPAPASALDGRRLGQTERHDTLAARNFRLTQGDLLLVKVRRSEVSAGETPARSFRCLTRNGCASSTR